MTVADYVRSKQSQIDCNELGLAPVELALCHSLHRIEIKGKRGRTVPMLLTELMHEALEVLVLKREKLQVPEANKYVFCCTSYGSLNHIRGADVVRENSILCGAELPDALRSTKLRKHIATMTQIVNLKDNELDILAGFLGHDIKIHREFYRLPHEAVEVAKVTKLLLALENGDINTLKGKELSQIEITDWLPCKFWTFTVLSSCHTLLENNFLNLSHIYSSLTRPS